MHVMISRLMHSNYSGLVGRVFSSAAMPGEYNLCMIGELCQQILTSAYYGTAASRISGVVCRSMVRGKSGLGPSQIHMV